MLDSFAQAALFVTSEYFIIALVSVGYLTYQKPIFGRALFLLLFTMILNPFLKDIWQIPLNPALGKTGYSFPSGHMQATTVLWLWLAFDLKKPFFAASSIILLGVVGFSLHHFGYHDWQDISAAVGFAVASILVFAVVTKLLKEKWHPYLGSVLALLGLVLIHFTSTHQAHVWIAIGALFGFSAGWSLYHRWDPEQWLFKKRFKVASGFAGIFIVYVLTEFIENFLVQETFNFVRFFLVALWVSYGAEFFVFKVHQKIHKS